MKILVIMTMMIIIIMIMNDHHHHNCLQTGKVELIQDWEKFAGRGARATETGEYQPHSLSFHCHIKLYFFFSNHIISCYVMSYHIISVITYCLIKLCKSSRGGWDIKSLWHCNIVILESNFQQYLIQYRSMFVIIKVSELKKQNRSLERGSKPGSSSSLAGRGWSSSSSWPCSSSLSPTSS